MLAAIFTLLIMLLPTTATLRSYLTAASITCCMREISEAKVATMTRPSASWITLSRASPTTCSDWV